ncbi:MAG: hypothetical protein ACTTKL_07790 [Treponema sp.]
MSFANLMPILKKILTNPAVIGTTVVVILYMNFCAFVANYRKKPPMPKKRRAAPAPTPQKKAQVQQTEEEHTDGSETE